MKKKPTRYVCPIYKIAYEFFIGWTWVEYIAYMDKYFKKHQEAHDSGGNFAGHCSFYEEMGLCLIFVRQKNNYATIAHECLHAANRTLHSRGWGPELLNDEPQALLMGSLMRAALGQNMHFYVKGK